MNTTVASSAEEIEQAVTLCSSELPNAVIIDQEFYIWKTILPAVPCKDRSQTLTVCRQNCTSQTFPVIQTCTQSVKTV